MSSSPIEPWTFTTPPRDRTCQVVLIAFGTGPLSDRVVMDPELFGAPSSEALEMCAVRTIDRPADPAWFDAWRSASLRAIAERDLEEEIEALDAADHAHLIVTEQESPADLTYLQGAWALARYLVARGARIVLDAHAMTFISADELPLVGAPLDTAREVRVVYETDSNRPDGAHAMHTRGMRKFGAPDLVALCTDADARVVAQAIAEVADVVARGAELATPTHALEVAPGVRWVVVEDEHALGDLLQLNNEARIIVDEHGHDLVGVVARLPRPNVS